MRKHFSIKETLCAGVPIVSMPVFAEQPFSGDYVVKAKIGRTLHKHVVSGPLLYSTIKEVGDALNAKIMLFDVVLSLLGAHRREFQASRSTLLENLPRSANRLARACAL